MNSNRPANLDTNPPAPLFGVRLVLVVDPVAELAVGVGFVLEKVFAALTEGKLELRAIVLTEGFTLLVDAVAYGVIFAGNDQIAHI